MLIVYCYSVMMNSTGKMITEIKSLKNTELHHCFKNQRRGDCVCCKDDVIPIECWCDCRMNSKGCERGINTTVTIELYYQIETRRVWFISL